ncbi:MAG: hypothetical protein KA352_08280 [Flavobacteriales bacterium]|nr:hypothetical protein [Flavobacteriales bacterium]
MIHRLAHFLTAMALATACANAQHGANDPTFNPGSGANGAIYATAIQTDGKIVIGGAFTSYNGTTRSGIARVNADGSLDTSFNPWAGLSGVLCVAQQPSGKILSGSAYVLRLNADGSLDIPFAETPGAWATFPVLIFSLAVQPDGKVIVAGQFSDYGGFTRPGLARINADGSLDTSFNPGTGASGGISSVALQPDGKIVIGGGFSGYNGIPRNKIARLNANGSLDLSFNPGTGPAPTTNGITSVTVQPDGKIIIGGDSFTSYNGIPRNRIARLNADGSLDTSFDPGTGFPGAVLSIQHQPDGKIIAAGGFSSYNGTPRNNITRLNADGSLDTGFNPGSGASGPIRSSALQPDGGIIIAGDFLTYNGTARNRIARVIGCGPDSDVDEDGVSICEGDLCDSDPFKTSPGICGCGTPDIDADGDGVYTCQGDLCDNDPAKTVPGLCGCGVPEGMEVCNGVDDDCDGLIDDADPSVIGTTTWYVDADSDGLGDPASATIGCAPAGSVLNGDDCNDSNALPCNNLCVADQSVLVNTPANCTYVHSGTAWDIAVPACSGELVTRFTSSAQGWEFRLPSGAGATVTHHASGGNPNGYITLTEPGGANTDWFQAPVLFLGDRSGMYGGVLEFDIKTNNVSTDSTVSLSHVQLDGPNTTILTNIQLPSLAWSSRSIPLSAGHWRINSTTLATEAQIREVLDNIVGFYIRAEYRTGPEATSVDNIEMVPGPPTYELSGATVGSGTSLSGVAFNEGTTMIDWTATNDCAYASICTFQVDVQTDLLWYPDLDGDGHGDPDTSLTACSPPGGYVANGNDCDDAHASVHPGAAEVCNGMDDDCDGLTDENCAALVSAKVFLEGPYSSGTGLMNAALRSLGTFPLTDPYPALGYVHTGSGNGGSVLPAVIAAGGNDAIVDWVLLELRDPTALSTVVSSRSALVQSDGDVVELDGVSPVAFSVPFGNYHLAIRHRNHLGIMKDAAIPLSAAPATVDFTTAATICYGTNARKNIAGVVPVEVLWAGDVNFNKQLKYAGSANDRDPLLTAIGGTVPTNTLNGQYRKEDINMNGQVKYAGSANDRDILLQNIGGSVPTAVRNAQLP